MSEVVIAAIGRTPIGRAVKGSLIDQRVRILATLLNDLRIRDQAIGLETMCVGGGQGMAMIVERVS